MVKAVTAEHECMHKNVAVGIQYGLMNPTATVMKTTSLCYVPSFMAKRDDVLALRRFKHRENDLKRL